MLSTNNHDQTDRDAMLASWLWLSSTGTLSSQGACRYDNEQKAGFAGCTTVSRVSLGSRSNTTPGRHLTLKERRGGMAEKDDKKDNEEYVGEIKGGLRPTMRLVVMGIVNKKPQSMVVSLSSDPVKEDFEGDVGLQVKVNFLDKAVQRNARLAGSWGTSENTVAYFPFAAGEPFKMEIVCEHQQFRILVDGQPLCGFTHRLSPLASLTALRVFGDLQLTKVA